MSHVAIRALLALSVLALFLLPVDSDARNPIKNAFLNRYPGAAGTQLTDLPSNANHCGICHFDFDGGGQRNPYGLGIEVGINNGLTYTNAIIAIEGNDSDGDGYTNLTEITSTLFGNTPTFPGLSASNYTATSNVTHSELLPYLTPSGGSDTTPPAVTVLSPNGGENLQAGGFTTVTYTATDASGISHVDFYYSDDGGSSWKPVGKNEAGTGSFDWFVPNLPSGTARIRAEAYDNVGNEGGDDSDGDFTVVAVPAGYVPTTLRDMELPGTQPFEGAILENPNDCGTCHGGYDVNVEPFYNWGGSMMGQAMRDPLFLACMAVAEQDAPSVGDLCLRCHTPGGWQEGRSIDTSGGMLNDKDLEGIQCDFCHRLVDHEYVPGFSPVEDSLVLSGIDPLPLQYGNGQFVNDPAPVRRGPYADAQAAHQFLESPFHRSADLCGICHDVSSPVFTQTGPFDYSPTSFDQEHPDFDVRNMMPIERTYSEWSQSAYADTGVYQPQFAGNKPDGIVSTCQDCHMRDVNGRGADGGPVRDDLALHDMMGGNAFIPDILPQFYPGEVDSLQLQAAKQRAIDMLQLAATVEATPTTAGVSVRVINETGHKLPSGYPEGRRIWLNVVALDGGGQTVFESGEYDFATGLLIHDEQEKIYEIHPGLSPGLAGFLGLPAGKSFHFVLVDTIYRDNRIPPRGSTNAGLLAIQSPVIDHAYADGQHWDDTEYTLPASAESVIVTLYYQTVTKEYVEFLRDENTTNSAGIDLYNAWVGQGRGAPIVMNRVGVSVNPSATGVTDAESGPALAYGLKPGSPNPFRDATTLSFTLPRRERASVKVFDINGRIVRTLVDDVVSGSTHAVTWDGRDERGREVGSGIYFIRFEAGSKSFVQRSVRLR